MISVLRQLKAAMGGGGQALPPWDDYWYQRPGYDSAAGMAVSPETAMRLSAVFGCVRVCSETLSSLPLIIYKQLPDGSKERALDHPLYRVLHDKPNIWQTSMEFIEMMQGHLKLRGNAFAHIVPGPGGAIDQLIPLHPDLVQVYRLPNGRLKYQVRSRWFGEIYWYTQDEIFHLRGLSSDGLVGVATVAAQRETIGSGLGMQDHSGRYFANGLTPSGYLKHPGKFKDDAAREKFRESFQKGNKQENQHKVMVLEDGLDYKAIGLSNKDSQFLEASMATDVKICGIFRVPPHKIGILDKASHSNIEQQNIEFVVNCIRPRAVRWERRMNADLIDPISEALGGGDYFAEFLLDGLLRGDLKSRMDAYAVSRQWGLTCPNDVARMENWNPIPGEKGGNDYWRPVNMVPTDAPIVVQQSLPPGDTPENPDEKKETDPPPSQKDSPSPEEPEDEGEDAPNNAITQRRLLSLFASEAAGRVVRKEVAALRKMLAKSPSAFGEEAAEFYQAHAALVAQTMCVTASSAQRYVNGNLKLLREASDPGDKSCVLDWIEDTAGQELAALALGQKRTRASLAPEGAKR